MSDASDLAAIRAALADVDARLVQLIAGRIQLARTAGDAKRHAGLPLRDIAREQQTLATVMNLARQHDLDAAAVREVFERLIAMARSAQGAD